MVSNEGKSTRNWWTIKQRFLKCLRYKYINIPKNKKTGNNQNCLRRQLMIKAGSTKRLCMGWGPPLFSSLLKCLVKFYAELGNTILWIMSDFQILIPIYIHLICPEQFCQWYLLFGLMWINKTVLLKSSFFSCIVLKVEWRIHLVNCIWDNFTHFYLSMITVKTDCYTLDQYHTVLTPVCESRPSRWFQHASKSSSG